MIKMKIRVTHTYPDCIYIFWQNIPSLYNNVVKPIILAAIANHYRVTIITLVVFQFKYRKYFLFWHGNINILLMIAKFKNNVKIIWCMPPIKQKRNLGKPRSKYPIPFHIYIYIYIRQTCRHMFETVDSIYIWSIKLGLKRWTVRFIKRKIKGLDGLFIKNENIWIFSTQSLYPTLPISHSLSLSTTAISTLYSASSAPLWHLPILSHPWPNDEHVREQLLSAGIIEVVLWVEAWPRSTPLFPPATVTH